MVNAIHHMRKSRHPESPHGRAIVSQKSPVVRQRVPVHELWDQDCNWDMSGKPAFPYFQSDLVAASNLPEKHTAHLSSPHKCICEEQFVFPKEPGDCDSFLQAHHTAFCS